VSDIAADSLKDLVVRTGTNGLVTDLVNLDHVRSMLKTISYRRRFLAMRQQAQDATADHGTIISLDGHVALIQSPFPLADVPEIVVVEDMLSTPPPMSSRDITSANRHSAGFSWIEPETPTWHDHFGTSDVSPLGGSSNGSSPLRGLRRDRRESDMSALSADFGLRHT
jgi:hypothetical protein